MAKKPSVIRHSELLHSFVLDRTTTDDRGRIEQLWMYPQAHRVLGFICKSGLMNQKRLAFTLPQIKAMREKNLWVEGDPTETEANQVKQLETLLYHEVWSESGAYLGKIKDCLFELKTGKITQYLVALRGWRSLFNELYALSPNDVLSFGKKRLLVSDRAGESMQSQRDRLQQTLTGLRRDYQAMKEELFTFSQRAQTITQETVQKTVDTFKDLKEQIGEHIGDSLSEIHSGFGDPDPDFEEINPEQPKSDEKMDSPETKANSSSEPTTVTQAWVEQIQAESELWTDLEEDSLADEDWQPQPSNPLPPEFQAPEFPELAIDDLDLEEFPLEEESEESMTQVPEIWDDWIEDNVQNSPPMNLQN